MRTKRQWIRIIGMASLLLGALALAGCGAAKAGQEEATSAPQPVTRTDSRVMAEGSLQPARSAQLAFQIPGTVEKVLVETGQQVAANELLIQLDRSELEIGLHSAEQDVLAQEAALRRLNKGATAAAIDRIDKANADQIAQAETVLEIKRLQLEQAEANDPELNVQAAQARIDQLERQLAQVRAQDPSAAVAAAQVEVERAQIHLDDVQDEYNQALGRP